MSDDEFATLLRASARRLAANPEIGPGIIAHAERLLAERARRRSPDPRQRALQREIDRQALALEDRLIRSSLETPLDAVPPRTARAGAP